MTEKTIKRCSCAPKACKDCEEQVEEAEDGFFSPYNNWLIIGESEQDEARRERDSGKT